ncbi:S1 RNA-binding domain-containing protein [Streptomyces sp. TRM66268-LWL]|uniref:S1 RNA-binding domain-containing protein n=1 Tax=Streptomyces polyasparticus TaxID=2767826 RepID=A0ABR7SEK0_9ACTN|nr:S1 RNA-binding domain-containing protein [Streptomyces polyasparticus]MBC9713402.1 S1 RNA-binding domain-containing protein [Streptomyces polyasparticus]
MIFDTARQGAEYPELWTFLSGLERGTHVSGTVAGIENFGVFVELDEGPRHPVYPGVGFITIPELSWVRFESPHEIIEVGQHITCQFLGFDTHQGEARLSLKILQPDPFQAFADERALGDVVPGTVTKVVPFGVFVRIGDDPFEGRVHRDLAGGPEWDTLEPGVPVTVVITELDRDRRRISLAWP